MRTLTLMLIVLLFCLVIPFQTTQALQVPNELFVCVNPDNRNAYLIPFRGNNLFGLVIAENATIVVYSINTVSVTIFPITPDVATGGYIPGRWIAVSLTTNDARRADLCRTSLRALNIDPENLLVTIPLPVSVNHMIQIQTGTDNNFVSPNIRGVVAFKFQQDVADFQYLQLNSTRMVQMSFPFLDPDETLSYLVVTNRQPVNISDVFDDGTVGEAIPTEAREIFTTRLNNAGLNLFTIMSNANMRIYPRSGRRTDYVYGTYIQLDMGSSTSQQRDFPEGYRITRIDGEPRFNSINVANPNIREPHVTSRSIIVRIDNGRLIVTAGGTGSQELFVEESWLVDAVPNTP